MTALTGPRDLRNFCTEKRYQRMLLEKGFLLLPALHYISSALRMIRTELHNISEKIGSVRPAKERNVWLEVLDIRHQCSPGRYIRRITHDDERFSNILHWVDATPLSEIDAIQNFEFFC